jgi:hypothetical protein
MKEYYRVLDKKKKYQYGVFPRTKLGKKMALKYLKKLQKETHSDFVIR